jgi:NTP pyrophosphatase (non-canonical NTP hydrolase)
MSGLRNEQLESLVARLRQFVSDRDWSQFHDPKNLAMAIASEAGELLAELRWISNHDADAAMADPALRGRIEHEVGDVAIALLLFCERTGIDLVVAAEKKLAINGMNYPAKSSRGSPDRPSLAQETQTISTTIAVDWSGKIQGGSDTIWVAEVHDGELVTLENGRSRDAVTNYLIEATRRDPKTVLGLDFAFAFPAWFARERRASDISELWRQVARDGESWLRECPAPFWGRPGVGKPSISEHFRQTERSLRRRTGNQPKSVFQIGGAGSVGVGSIRGMPHLLRMREAGLSIWPFDPPTLPFAIEIYPRVLTGPVVKSSPGARTAYLAEIWPSLRGELRETAASTEDAFDAAVSALVMWRHADALGSLPTIADVCTLIEGEIWAPPTPA